MIVDLVRTPRGRGRPSSANKPGSLAGVPPRELVAQLLTALLDRNSLPSDEVDDVVLGCVSQVDEQGAWRRPSSPCASPAGKASPR